MIGKPARVSRATMRSKRSPRLWRRSAKASALHVAALVEAVLETGFASTAKPPREKQYVKKTAIFQMDAGDLSSSEGPVISKPQSEGFAAKQLPSDPAWFALQQDLSTMSTMQLRAKYPGEANTHRNMLQRVKTCGAVVHPAFRSFPDFLRLVGPKPTRLATLDRIDNHDPEYAPGKVRWADKTTQNRNKSDNLIFTCPNTGRSYTASQLAAKQGVSPTAIRKRRRQGWTDAEVCAGERAVIAFVRKAGNADFSFRPSVIPQTAAQIMFQRNRRSCELCRQENGTEEFIMTPLEFQEIMADEFPEYRSDQWLRSAEERFLRSKLPRWWKEFKPHIRFHALRPDQQAWVLKIDPSQGQKSELSDAV